MNIEILNWPGPPWEVEVKRSKKGCKKGINWSSNTHIHGNNTRKLPV
jgi:hypothetical protein